VSNRRIHPSHNEATSGERMTNTGRIGQESFALLAAGDSQAALSLATVPPSPDNLRFDDVNRRLTKAQVALFIAAGEDLRVGAATWINPELASAPDATKERGLARGSQTVSLGVSRSAQRLIDGRFQPFWNVGTGGEGGFEPPVDFQGLRWFSKRCSAISGRPRLSLGIPLCH